MTDEKTLSEKDIDEIRQQVLDLRREIHRAVVGQDEVIESTLIGLFAGGHVLLEGVPGLGKTLLVKSLAAVLDLEFSRIQFTPDLMPADITGTNIVVEDQRGHRSFQFQRGPVFSNIVLADEINRATPKTQSALLEAMQESTVTIHGTRHDLPQPFYVLATQNPIEMEGTYPLPEAQLDRFLFKVLVRFPVRNDLLRVIDQTTRNSENILTRVMNGSRVRQIRDLARQVLLAPPVAEYAADIVMATHGDSPLAPPAVRRFLRFGSSPRGGQSMVLAAKVQALLAGRLNVSYEDIRHMAKPALRHRLILNFEGEAEGQTTDSLIDEVLKAVKPPTRG